MISMILPSDSVGRSSSVSAVDLLSTTAVSNFSSVGSVSPGIEKLIKLMLLYFCIKRIIINQPVLRQSGEKSIGSESVMMSFQGWN